MGSELRGFADWRTRPITPPPPKPKRKCERCGAYLARDNPRTLCAPCDTGELGSRIPAWAPGLIDHDLADGEMISRLSRVLRKRLRMPSTIGEAATEPPEADRWVDTRGIKGTPWREVVRMFLASNDASWEMPMAAYCNLRWAVKAEDAREEVRARRFRETCWLERVEDNG